MDFFENLGKKITDTGKTAVRKTKDFGETTKLHGEISTYQRKINELYTEIGREYALQHKDDAPEPFDHWVRQIAEAQGEIDKRTERIEELKTNGGGDTEQEPQSGNIPFLCPNCGAALTSDAQFCASCGYQVKQESKNKCAQCGAELTEEAAFCESCGHKQ